MHDVSPFHRSTGRSRGLVAALALSGSVLTAAWPAPAHGDEVAAAQDRVDRLQGVVVETTRRLVDGTRAWEADQAALKRVQLQLSNTQRHIRESEAVAAAGQDRLDQLARRLYTSPLPGTVQMMVTRSPEEFFGAVQGVQLLNKAAGTDEVVIRQALTARHRFRQKELQAQFLTTRAQQLVSESAKRLNALQALAQSTAHQLVAAQDALQSARARKAAIEAARAKAARERAARSRYTYAGGPACTGKSTEGQQNGNLDPASLCPLWMAPGHRLRGDAASAFNKMSKYHAATVGGPLCVTDSYRSYSEQAELYRRKPGLAAVPGTSEHGWGKAVDLCGGVENFGSAAYRWMKANAGRFGWFHPDWAEPSGSKPEAWHWEFSG